MRKNQIYGGQKIIERKLKKGESKVRYGQKNILKGEITMKKFNKVLAVVLAVLMLAMTAIPAFAANEKIILDEVYLIISDEPNEDTVFEYTAEETGRYEFFVYTDGTASTANTIVCDDDGNVIAQDCMDDMNYSICFNMEAGKTYYIFTYSSDNWAAYNVRLELEHNCFYEDYDADAVCDECDFDYCNHKCHDNGFFWRIANFFNRLFRINEWCECGNAHW